MTEANSQQARGAAMMRDSGYHPDAKEDAEEIEAMVKPEALKKRKRGGEVKGKEPEHRPDKRARGGAMKGPKIGAVNVNVHHSDPAAEAMAKQQGMRQGIQAGARMAAMRGANPAAQAPRPPMMPPPGAAPPGAPMGAPPMGARPPMQGAPMGAKDGGAVHKREDGGEC
jgi:hypothetical protein